LQPTYFKILFIVLFLFLLQVFGMQTPQDILSQYCYKLHNVYICFFSFLGVQYVGKISIIAIFNLIFGEVLEQVREKNLDISSGSVLKKLCKYFLPLMLTSVLHLAFNSADIIIVKMGANGNDSVSAIGATGSIIALIVNFFMGFSVGITYVISKSFGAKDYQKMKRGVSTALLLALIVGVVMTIGGLFAASPMLQLMDTDGVPTISDSGVSLLPAAARYLKVYFLGMIPFMIYNYGAAILRAVGDTRRPLIFLIIAGVSNVLLNLFFVLVCHMDVEGVALATAISQVISATLVVITLSKEKSAVRLCIKELRLHRSELKEILLVGMPAGVQSSMFAISNIVIQSGVNSFHNGFIATGNAAAQQIEGYNYVAMDAITQTALTFIGYHYGAKKFSQINRLLKYCLALVSVVGIAIGCTMYLFKAPLYSLFIENSEDLSTVIAFASTRGKWILLPHFLCGVMNVLASSVRGMGKSVLPMLVSIIGTTVLRVVWVLTVFAFVFAQFDALYSITNLTLLSENFSYITTALSVLYSCYLMTFFFSSVAHFVCYIFVRRKLPKEDVTEQQKEPLCQTGQAAA
jgi:putative MATE family efflux protein